MNPENKPIQTKIRCSHPIIIKNKEKSSAGALKTMVMEPYFCKRYRKPPYNIRDRSDHERLQDQQKREHQSVH